MQQFLANPQNLNSYAYSLNNPLRYSDPKGNSPLLFVIAAVLTVYSAVQIGVDIHDYKIAVSKEEKEKTSFNTIKDIAFFAAGFGGLKNSVGIAVNIAGQLADWAVSSPTRMAMHAPYMRAT